MKTALALVLVWCSVGLAADALTEKLQRGLFEEEANRNLEAAIKEYQAVVAQADEQRRIVATALFRLGECYRKLGRTNDAAGMYQRILRDFSEQDQLTTVIRERRAVPSDAGDDAGGRVRELERREDRLRLDLSRANSRLDAWNRLSREQLLETAVATSRDSKLAALQEQLRTTDQKLAEAGVTLGAEHPEMQALTALKKTIVQQRDAALDGFLMAAKNETMPLFEAWKSAKADLEAATAGRSPVSQPSAVPWKTVTAPEQVRLLEEEIRLAEQVVANVEQRMGAGKATLFELLQAKKDVLPLKRMLPANASQARQRTLIEEQTSLVRQLLADFEKRIEVGTLPPGEQLPIQRELLSLRRELAMVNGATTADAQPAPEPAMTQPEAEELARVKALARNSPDLLNARHKESLTSLQWAAQQGFPTVLEFLLAQGLDVNGPENSTPPIVLAAQRGHLRIVEMLLDRGADVNAGLNGYTALMGAVNQRFKSIVDLLLARGADVRRGTSGNSTALHLAASRGDTNMVALLLARKADVNVLTDRSNPQNYSAPGPGIETTEFDAYNGATPLHSAARLGSVPLVEMLLRSRAQVNATNWAGTTPLHLAVALGHANVIQLLLANQADPSIRDGAGATPMALAVPKGASFTKALLEAGADVNRPAYERPDFTTFPLHIAAGISLPDSLRLLLAARPNLEVINTEGHTPLWSALQRSLATNAQLLIEAGADVRARFSQQTPIRSAVQQGLEPVVVALLKAGANADEQDESGNSLLHLAVSQSPGVVRALLEHGANPNVLNNEAYTPLSVALSVNRSQRTTRAVAIPSRGSVAQVQASGEEAREEIVALLKKHGADEFMQRRLRIAVSRGAASVPVFTRGTNLLNRFTLMELLGANKVHPRHDETLIRIGLGSRSQSRRRVGAG